MKTLFLTCLMGLFSIVSVTAQNHSFDRLFDRYADKDGFLTLKFSNLPSDMLNDNDKDPDFRINSLRILTVQDEKLNSKLNFYKEILPQVNRKDYEELMTVKRNGEKAILFCKKDNKRITEVLFVSGGEKNVMVEISGSMSLSQAKKITANITEDDEDSN
jgi:hypothetical protein